MDLQLNDRTCLITGASQGIGKGTARVMAAEGCRIAILARRKALLDELADEIASTGARDPAGRWGGFIPSPGPAPPGRSLWVIIKDLWYQGRIRGPMPIVLSLLATWESHLGNPG